MKRYWLYFFSLAGVLLSGRCVSAQVVVDSSVIVEIKKACGSLFDALRDGDVQAIKRYLSPVEYARYKVLFEQNKDYPRFLQDYYQGASFRVGQIDSVRSAKDEVIGELVIDFPNGETTITRMRLNRVKGGEWKVKKILAGKKDQGEPSGEDGR